MKKTLALLLAAFMLPGLLAGCSGSSSAGASASGSPTTGGEVNVYNWGVYIDESIFDEFEQQTGIKVNYNTYESNEALYGVLKNEGASYDVIIPSDYMISRMIQEDMLNRWTSTRSLISPTLTRS